MGSNALTKLRSENLWKLRIAIINRPINRSFLLTTKKELLSSLFFYKTSANTKLFNELTR